MSAPGFWVDGPGEHRRAYEQHMADLRKRLEYCKPKDRAQIASEIEDAEKEMPKSGDGQILW